jgi:predicted metal-binding protein
MKIAILHCRKSMDVCTGAACFKAYNHDLASFAQYAGNRPELAAFFDCGGAASTAPKMRACKRRWSG